MDVSKSYGRCKFLKDDVDDIIASGRKTLLFVRCEAGSTILINDFNGAVVFNHLVQEDGDLVLLESGDKMRLEG